MGKKYFLQSVSNPIAAQVLCELLAIARQLAMQLSCCKSRGEAGKAGRGSCFLLCPLVLGTKSALLGCVRWGSWSHESWGLTAQECFTLFGFFHFMGASPWHREHPTSSYSLTCVWFCSQLLYVLVLSWLMQVMLSSQNHK